MQKSKVIRINRWKDAKQSVDAGNEKEFQELNDALERYPGCKDDFLGIVADWLDEKAGFL